MTERKLSSLKSLKIPQNTTLSHLAYKIFNSAYSKTYTIISAILLAPTDF